MTAALRARIEELEEEIRQLKAAFAPKVGFPLAWRLDAQEGAILSALFNAKGSYVTPEALLRCIVGFIERIERLEEEKAGIAGDIREVFAELKGRGFDARAVRTILRIRKQDQAERQEQEAILALYLQALGMA